MGYLEHSDDEKDPEKPDEGKENGDDDGKTIEEVFDTLTETQKTAVYAIIGQAVEDGESENNDDSEGGDETMKHGKCVTWNRGCIVRNSQDQCLSPNGFPGNGFDRVS